MGPVELPHISECKICFNCYKQFDDRPEPELVFKKDLMTPWYYEVICPYCGIMRAVFLSEDN